MAVQSVVEVVDSSDGHFLNSDGAIMNVQISAPSAQHT